MMNETPFAQQLEQKMVLQKVVKSKLGMNSCCGIKLVDRNVIIGTDIELRLLHIHKISRRQKSRNRKT